MTTTFHRHWRDVRESAWRWPNFSPAEIACRGTGNGIQVMETRWRDASENEKRSRARFAQNAMKPSEVAPEWDKVKSLLGSPAETLEFLERAMSRFGVPLEKKKSLQFAHVHALQDSLKEKLEQRGLKGSLRLATQEPVPSGASLLTRTHPLTGIVDKPLLRASHIKPWRDCENDAERLDVHNGLLLSALWDAVFDSGLVTFGDDGSPVFSKSLSDQGRAALHFNGPIVLTDEHRRFLNWHRSCVFSD